jgi:hypothetical protein
MKGAGGLDERRGAWRMSAIRFAGRSRLVVVRLISDHAECVSSEIALVRSELREATSVVMQ